MKLSVIIPAFNAEKTICQCLDSVLAQSVKDLELIVINDGSEDSTEEILNRYANQYPDTIRTATVENGGQGRARNVGMNMATGEYLGFVDSDDWIEPKMYEKLLSASVDENADLVLCDVTAHFPDGSTTPE